LAKNSLADTFNFIITSSKKENTYKFAFARFLIDYARKLKIAQIKRMKKIKNQRLLKRGRSQSIS